MREYLHNRRAYRSRIGREPQPVHHLTATFITLLSVGLLIASFVTVIIFQQPPYPTWTTEPKVNDPSLRSSIASECRMSRPDIAESRGKIFLAAQRSDDELYYCFGTKDQRNFEGLGDAPVRSRVQPYDGTVRAPKGTGNFKIIYYGPIGTNSIGIKPKKATLIIGTCPASTNIRVVAAVGNVTVSQGRGYFAAWWPGSPSDDDYLSIHDKDGYHLNALKFYKSSGTQD